MLKDLIALYDKLVAKFWAGTATDEECETLQDVSVMLQEKGYPI